MLRWRYNLSARAASDWRSCFAIVIRHLSAQPNPSSIPLGVPTYAVWGANTGVGKTLICAGLGRAAVCNQVTFTYIKPVQTGYPQDSDARSVALACGQSGAELAGPHAQHLHTPPSTKAEDPRLPTPRAGASAPPVGVPPLPAAKFTVLHAWAHAVGPHLAVGLEGRPVSDDELVRSTLAEMHHPAPARSSPTAITTGTSEGAAPATRQALMLVETAGGVASPAPSGRLQCDVLRALRLPALLVGDARLGGISTTISAYESLITRGYDVPVIVMLAAHAPDDSPQVAEEVAPVHRVPPLCDSLRAAPAPASGSNAPPAPTLNNAAALAQHFGSIVHHPGGVAPVVFVLPPLVQRLPASADAMSGKVDATLAAWLTVAEPSLTQLLALLQRQNEARLAALQASAARASSQLWWPFTQHATLPDKAVQVVDARAGEHWHVYRSAQAGQRLQSPSASAAAAPSSVAPTASTSAAELSSDAPAARLALSEGPAAVVSDLDSAALVPLYDACGSWWTQGLSAELQPEVVRAVAAATGRYMHVMFPEVAHEPALSAAERLLETVGKGWASRVFFSDNGSTAIEIALKMAFRKYLTDHKLHQAMGAGTLGHSIGLDVAPLDLHVIGLRNAYHGDTLGAVDCVAPSVFNTALQAPWYSGGRGLFLEPPYVAMKDGMWRLVDSPPWMGDDAGAEGWGSLDELFDEDRDRDAWAKRYQRAIRAEICSHEDKCRDTSAGDRGTSRRVRLAACIIEPVVQGAGGMLVVDPLYLKALIKVCRSSRIPVIFDEVFTGLYRLGALSAAALLGEAPDIACYGKLLTAGTMPMAATLATEDVFKAFNGDSKLYALLHGHSYTAFPAGCAAAAASLNLLTSPAANPNLCTPRPRTRPSNDRLVSSDGCSSSSSSSGTSSHITGGGGSSSQAAATSRCRKALDGGEECGEACGRLLPLWDDTTVRELSGHPLVSHLVAVGTLLAVTLKTPAAGTASGGGYGSGGAAAVVLRLREEHGVMARPLGSVVYLMVTPTTQRAACSALLAKLQAALDGCLQAKPDYDRAGVRRDGYVV